MRRLILATFGILLLGTLGGIVWLGANDAPSHSAVGRRPILEQSIEMVARPGIDRLVAAVAELKADTRQLSESPGPETLKACQEAWRHAHKAWKQFQPSSGACGLDTTLVSEISNWPAFASSIENVVKSPRALDPAFFEILGAGAKGFYALEYLLFDLPAGNAGKIGNDSAPKKPRLSATNLLEGPTAERRRAYVLGLAEHLANRCGTLQRSIHDPALRGQWAERGQDALNQLVNHLVEVLEVGGVGRIARQLELIDNRRLTREGIEGIASGASLTSFSALLDGTEQLYCGADGPGLDDEARALSHELADRLRMQFRRARSAVAAIDLPMDEAIIKSRATVEQALAEMRALEVLLKADLASALGVTITFGSNDGD